MRKAIAASNALVPVDLELPVREHGGRDERVAGCDDVSLGIDEIQRPEGLGYLEREQHVDIAFDHKWTFE